MKLYVHFLMRPHTDHREFEVRDYIRDDATFLYDLIRQIDVNKGEAKNKSRTVCRIIRKLREPFYNAVEWDVEGEKECVGDVDFSPEELEFLSDFVVNLKEEGKVFGKDLETVLMVKDYFKKFKEDNPELFSGHDEGDGDKDKSP